MRPGYVSEAGGADAVPPKAGGGVVASKAGGVVPPPLVAIPRRPAVASPRKAVAPRAVQRRVAGRDREAVRRIRRGPVGGEAVAEG